MSETERVCYRPAAPLRDRGYSITCRQMQRMYVRVGFRSSPKTRATIYATLTPLERPAAFASKQFLSNEDAVAFEKEMLRTGNQPLGSGPAIDDLWLERGHLAIVNGRYPTSLVSDPPDGRIPELTEGAKARIARRAEAGTRSGGPRIARLASDASGAPQNHRCSQAPMQTSYRSFRAPTM